MSCSCRPGRHPLPWLTLPSRILACHLGLTLRLSVRSDVDLTQTYTAIFVCVVFSFHQALLQSNFSPPSAPPAAITSVCFPVCAFSLLHTRHCQALLTRRCPSQGSAQMQVSRTQTNTVTVTATINPNPHAVDPQSACCKLALTVNLVVLRSSSCPILLKCSLASLDQSTAD